MSKVLICKTGFDWENADIEVMLVPDDFDIVKERELHKEHVDTVIVPYRRSLPIDGKCRRIVDREEYREVTKFEVFEHWLVSRPYINTDTSGKVIISDEY